MVRREQFVTTRQFLESARSLDITTIECFYELFDNAFDADATSIRAHIEKKDNGNLRFYIIDNGRGIPAVVTEMTGSCTRAFPTSWPTAVSLIPDANSPFHREVRRISQTALPVHPYRSLHQDLQRRGMALRLLRL